METCVDYVADVGGIPKADVLKFTLEGGCSSVVRPSGTETKVKVYLSAGAESREEAMEISRDILSCIEALF